MTREPTQPFVVRAEDIAGDPTAVGSSERLDVIALGTDGTPRHFVVTDGEWDVRPLPTPAGRLVGAPTLIRWAPDRLHLFLRDDAGALQYAIFDGNTWSWIGLASGTHAVASDPSVASWAPGRLDLFVRTAAGTLDHYWYHDEVGFQGPEDCGGPVAGRPAVTTTSRFGLHVLVRGDDGLLRYQYAWPERRGHDWSTTPWQPSRGGFVMGPADSGGLTGDPVVVRCRGRGLVENRLAVYARRGAELLRLEPWQWDGGGTLRDRVVGAGVSADVAAVSVRPGRVDAFAPMTDGTVGHLVEEFGPDGSATARWTAVDADVAVSGRIAATGAGNRIDLFFRDGNDRLHHGGLSCGADGWPAP